MSPETNAQTFRTKSSKLSAFARHSSDGEANYNAAPVKASDSLPKRSDTPVLPSSAPAREDMAKSALVPAPQLSRYAAPVQNAPASPKRAPPQSPQRHSTQPPAPLPSRQNLFAGSQLGDDFMASGLTSGLTTPHVEFHEPITNVNLSNVPAEELVRDRPHQNKPDDKFKLPLANNGLFLPKAVTEHEPPVYMADGFQNGTTNHRRRYRAENDRPQSPIRRAVKLPIREEPRKARAVIEDIRRERARSPSADYRRHHDQDNGDRVGSHNSRSYGHETPKASRRNTQRHSAGSPSRVPAKLSSPPPSRKHRRVSPDYDDSVLGAKTFSELQREPFDLDPAKTVILNGDGSPGDNLAKRLERIQTQPEVDQRAYFGTMPLDEWEASGDWFVDQFSSLMTRFKDARKEKRRLVREFEAEAARREEAVRLRTDAIDDKLVKMRQDGQRVVGSRML